MTAPRLASYSLRPLVSSYRTLAWHAYRLAECCTVGVAALCCCVSPSLLCDMERADDASESWISVKSSGLTSIEAGDTSRSSNLRSGAPFVPSTAMLDFSKTEQDCPLAESRCSEFWSFVQEQPALDSIKRAPVVDKVPPESDKKLPAEVTKEKKTRSYMTPFNFVLDKGGVEAAMVTVSPERCGLQQSDITFLSTREQEGGLAQQALAVAPKYANMYSGGL